MLCKMDNAPRQSAYVPVPNQRYFNDVFDTSGTRRLSNTELLAAAYVGCDPTSYKEAMRSEEADEWREACQYEMDALAKNDT